MRQGAGLRGLREPFPLGTAMTGGAQSHPPKGMDLESLMGWKDCHMSFLPGKVGVGAPFFCQPFPSPAWEGGDLQLCPPSSFSGPHSLPLLPLRPALDQLSELPNPHPLRYKSLSMVTACPPCNRFSGLQTRIGTPTIGSLVPAPLGLGWGSTTSIPGCQLAGSRWWYFSASIITCADAYNKFPLRYISIYPIGSVSMEDPDLDILSCQSPSRHVAQAPLPCRSARLE